MRSIKHLPSRLTATLFIGLGLAACSQVQYRAADASKSVATIPFDRMVHFQVARAFYESPPRCAFVLPSQGEAAKSRPGRLIEEAAARQLSFRIERVIGPDRRDQLARQLITAVGTNHPFNTEGELPGGGFLDQTARSGFGCFALRRQDECTSRWAFVESAGDLKMYHAIERDRGHRLARVGGAVLNLRACR